MFIKIQLRNLDQTYAFKAQPSVSLKVLTKLHLFRLDKNPASKFSASNLKPQILTRQLQYCDQNQGLNLNFKISTKLSSTFLSINISNTNNIFEGQSHISQVY